MVRPRDMPGPGGVRSQQVVLFGAGRPCLLLRHDLHEPDLHGPAEISVQSLADSARLGVKTWRCDRIEWGAPPAPALAPPFTVNGEIVIDLDLELDLVKTHQRAEHH